jgi:hypothetical protein
MNRNAGAPLNDLVADNDIQDRDSGVTDDKGTLVGARNPRPDLEETLHG